MARKKQPSVYLFGAVYELVLGLISCTPIQT